MAHTLIWKFCRRPWGCSDFGDELRGSMGWSNCFRQVVNINLSSQSEVLVAHKPWNLTTRDDTKGHTDHELRPGRNQRQLKRFELRPNN